MSGLWRPWLVVRKNLLDKAAFENNKAVITNRFSIVIR
jgi:hypothetical protein